MRVIIYEHSNRIILFYIYVGDGSTDDTEAINNAISSGNRCGQNCDSSTTTPALVYFPSGTYVVSKPVIQYYFTQMVGDALSPPVLKAAPGFQGMAVVDADPYTDTGSNWYTNQNNFFRSIRNFVIDLTAMPSGSGAGIHWQVAQATSLQNIRFEMVKGGGDGNKQTGIFMDNGSGGFMADLVFNGGNYGAFLGSQQFTSRNLTFNDCNTAIFMNWNWAWTFKSLQINNCDVGLNMSNSPEKQTVGSIMLLDATLTNTPTGVVTAYTHDSSPVGGGVLVLDNVDFSGSRAAVSGISGNNILAGGSVVPYWVQGQAYTPSQAAGPTKRDDDEVEIQTVTVTADADACPATASPTVSSSSSSMDNIPAAATSMTTASSSSSISSSIPSTCASKPIGGSRIQNAMTVPPKPDQLLDTRGRVFERSRPLYEEYPATSFVSVKSAGAKGDGMSDDTAAIQTVLNNVQDGQIVYFDHGQYVITSTIMVPKNIKIAGEVWPTLMASGPSFGDQMHPIPMLQIGGKGDVGAVELSDLVLSTKGPAPGAILMEWNVASSAQGSTGMWDVHFRVGGATGSELQSNLCAKDPTATNNDPNPKCIGAFLLLHVTETAMGAYIENSWAWTADHELDLPDHGQINIYTGRGILIESNRGPVWMYGTASEHNQLYNYQVSNASSVFMGMIQTETPYYQSNPDALIPFTPQPSTWNDPDFSDCSTPSCRKAWGLRVADAREVYVYGAGLYSFFDNYGQQCLDPETCQLNIVQVDSCSDVTISGLSTKASSNMVTASNGQSLVQQSENESTFCSTIGLFRQQ